MLKCRRSETGMDGLAHIESGERSHPEIAPFPKGDPIPVVGTLHARLAWPVAERMLQILASNREPPQLRAADFVKETLEATFAGEVTYCAERSKADGESHEGVEIRRFSVVDAALGILGYGATAIYDRKISILVDMLTSLVQSKVSCGFHSYGCLCEQRMFSSVLLRILESCTPFFVSGTANSKQVLAVIDAVMSVAVNTSLFTPHSEAFETMYKKMVHANEDQAKRCPASALRSFVDYVVEEKDFTFLRLQPCSRLRIWRLQPLSLKQDLSCLAREAMERLLLPLGKELCEREEWATLVVCLALAPDLFTEARRLLHSWFLHSGAMRLWELRADLVSAVWKVLNCSFVRGVTPETSLPPQNAFYHTSLRPYIVILRCVPTLNGLVNLVRLLDHVENLNHSSSADPASTGASTNKEEEDPLGDSRHLNHNSIWALLIDFLPWLHFAFRVLFRSGRSQQIPTSKSCGQVAEAVTAQDLEGAAFSIDGGDGQTSSRVAAKYIAWILSPTDFNLRGSEEHMLLQCSERWQKVMGAVHGDVNPVFSSGDDAHLLQCGEQPIFTDGGRCRFSVCRVKRQKCGETDSTFGRQSDDIAVRSRSFFLAALDLWLTDLLRKLGADKHGIHLGGLRFVDKVDKVENQVTCSCYEKRAHVGQTHFDYKQNVFMANFLVLGALAESLATCSPHIICHLVKFVGRGGIHASSEEMKSPQTGTEDGTGSSIPLRARATEHKRSECQADDSLGNYAAPEKQRSANWIPGSAALFTFLDFVDEDFVRGTALSESEPKAAKIEVHENLAITMSELVSEWGSISQNEPSTTVFPKCSSRERHLVILEDLRQRFGSWVGKLQLSTETERTCDLAKKELDSRIETLRSLLISS